MPPKAGSLGRRAALRAIAGVPVSLWLSRALARGEIPIQQGFNRLTGEVTLNGRPASLGARISPGDRIATGPGAQALYVVGQDAFLQRERTEVRFGSAAADFLRILSGKLLSVFGRGDKTITTAVATIGIRGTGCYIEAEASRDYFCLCYGEAQVQLNADPSRQETLRTRHHDHPVVLTPAGGADWMAGAKVVNHTDEELTLLESLVGRRPPFYGQPWAGSY